MNLYAKYDETVYLVSTEAQLREVAKYSTSHFRLYNDIELQADWTPIGSDEGNAFEGRFEGRGYAIRKVKISMPMGDYVGLFGVEVASIEGAAHVGALVGLNTEYVSGYAIGGKVKGGSYLGGLVGANGSPRYLFAVAMAMRR